MIQTMNMSSRRSGAEAGRAEEVSMHPRHERHEDAVRLPSEQADQAGFTLVELLAALFIATLLATIGLNEFQNYRERTKLVKCMAEIRGIQAAVYNMGDGRIIPDPTTFWETAFPDGRKHGPYFYIIDGDPNEGHGNDLDGVDETNPGASDPDEEDIKFVILCDHDHGDLGKYVYLTDEGPPVVVHGDGDDPGYEKFIKWEFGGPGAK
jgi:prepilin-type N-terminal cleavage/methylation domain-containing protein